MYMGFPSKNWKILLTANRVLGIKTKYRMLK